MVRSRRGWGPAGWLVLVTIALGTTPAAAGGPSPPARGPRRDLAEEEAYARPLAAIDPALARTFHDGTAALDARRFPEARAALEKIVARAPAHAPTLRRLSYVLSETGDVDGAIATARRACAASADPYSDYALANALLKKKGDSAASSEAAEIARRLLRGNASEEAAGAAATIAVERQDLELLGRAVEALQRVAPQGMTAGYMAALYLAARGDLDQADQALARAEAAGLPAEVVTSIREGTGIGRHRLLMRLARVAVGGLALWLLGLLLIFVVGRIMSRVALSAVERLAPDRSDALIVETRRLRRAYAGAIGFAAAYYFLSIPVVIALVLGLGSLAVYAMLLIGWIPIKLLILVVIGVLISMWALARSIFVRRVQDTDPGPRLLEADAPALWALLREVAAQVGTRPVDLVYLTPGTEVAVAERGTMTARLRDHGQRYLILGVGVLDGLTQRQLRAVLAHEYGHFSHRDTAGGDLAGTVRASLLAAIIRLASAGGASVLNPAWHFLRLFFALFQRITLGASRLQEVLADRFAAAAYGGPTLAEGLAHVVRRSVEFEAKADVIIKRAQEQRRAIASLYVLPPEGAVPAQDLETAIAKAMSEAGSPYDSHPPVGRRLAWLAAFGAASQPASAGLATADPAAWELFPDRASTEARMTAIVNGRLDAAGHIDVPVPASVASPLGPRL